MSALSRSCCITDRIRATRRFSQLFAKALRSAFCVRKKF